MIRTWTRGPYSHIIWFRDGDGIVSASNRDGGVREKQITLKARALGHCGCTLAPAADLDDRIREELGCAYDWIGIFFSQGCLLSARMVLFRVLCLGHRPVTITVTAPTLFIIEVRDPRSEQHSRTLRESGSRAALTANRESPTTTIDRLAVTRRRAARQDQNIRVTMESIETVNPVNPVAPYLGGKQSFKAYHRAH